MSFPDKKTIGVRIRRIRRALDLTQAEVAAIAGIDRGEWSNHERGMRNCRVDTLGKIADALGCPLSDLVADSA